MTDQEKSSSTKTPTTDDAAVQGQKYAFATASLLMGICCFTNLLGMEKALLAILFGWLALRAPRVRLRRGWAMAGIGLGVVMIVTVAVVVIVKFDELAQIIQYLEQFG